MGVPFSKKIGGNPNYPPTMVCCPAHPDFPETSSTRSGRTRSRWQVSYPELAGGIPGKEGPPQPGNLVGAIVPDILDRETVVPGPDQGECFVLPGDEVVGVPSGSGICREVRSEPYICADS